MRLTHHQANAITGATWFFGFAALFYTGSWWPGMMILVGITILVQGLVNNQLWASLNGALWCFGIAVLAYFHWNLVALFVILGFCVLLNGFVRPPFLEKKPKPQTDNSLE
jgi:hypothetical protein